jgi:hypothetical protein
MAFKMKGYSYPGTSPLKDTTEPMKPASSKEELIETARGFILPAQAMDLDYGGGFDVDINVDILGASDTLPPPKPKPPSGEKPIVTRTPEEIMGIKKDRMDVKGASKQKHYKSGGGFGEDNKDIKAPEVKTYKTADESKNRKEKKVRVMTPKELTKKYKKAGKPITKDEKKKVEKEKKTTTPKIKKSKKKSKKKVKKSGNKKSNWLKGLFKRKN